MHGHYAIWIASYATHNPVGQWMHCMKLLGQSLMARDFERQVAEIQIRIVVINR